MTATDPARLTIDTIRVLAMDAVQNANAGHPGTAMALAPVAYLLYAEEMRHDPSTPDWPGRDRFVLSAGHACILQYASLHLSGYDVTMDDLQHFRQWGSRTPGHPELGHTPGVETTTGPLGQGFANGTITFALHDGGGDIHTSAQITGKAASMGEGVVSGVLDALISDFAGKLGQL